MKDAENNSLIVSELLLAFNPNFYVSLKDADSKSQVYVGKLINYPRYNEILNLEIKQLYASNPVGSSTPMLTLLIKNLDVSPFRAIDVE